MKTSISLILCTFLFWICTTAQNFQSIDTSFQTLGVTLEGTVTLPNGSGPFPGVVIVHGSGPTDQNATFTVTTGNPACLYPNLVNQTLTPYRDLAEGLAAAGIATFRYNKRTVNHASSLDPTTMTIDIFETDAKNAVDFFAGWNAIHPDELYLVGHSQGSTFIPKIAQKHGNIAGLISLAGNTTPIDTLIGYQTRELFYRCQNDTAQGNQQEAAILSALKMVRNGTWNPSSPLLGAYAPFWLSWINATDSVIERYQTANLRTLILQGKNDFNVPSTEAEAFEALDPTRTKIVFFDELNHFFNNGVSKEFDATALQTIIDFILNPSTGINSLEKPSIKLIQTPDLLKINLTKTDRIHYSIFDLSGKILLSKTVNNSQTIEINRSSLSGWHILHAETEKNGQLKRICYF